MSPKTKGILETVLYVDDIMAASDFYERVFGLARVFGDSRMCVLRVSAANHLLLFERGKAGSAVEVPGGVIPPHFAEGQIHVALTMDHDDRGPWMDHLRERGIEIESIVEWPSGGLSLYVRDPSENLVELATPDLWT